MGFSLLNTQKNRNNIEMLHDIVLALNGVGGQALKNIINEDAVLLLLSINPCEKTILEKLIRIADSFKNLQNFIKKVPQFGNKPIVIGGETVLSPGMYVRALCTGLSAGLQPYRACLDALERDLVRDAHLTLTEVLARVGPFSPLLLTLNTIIDQVVSRRLHGCSILQLLHEHLSSGQDTVDAAVRSMMVSCHRVLLKQLTCWLVHGQLMDPFFEFFIEEVPQTSQEVHSSMTTLNSDSVPPDHCADEGGGVAEYRVLGERVPSYFPASVPDKVRFIGTTVLLFSRDPRQRTLGCRSEHEEVLRRMERSVLERIQAMQAAPTGLDVAALDATVDSVRSSVTQHLLSLARDEAGLVGELRLIREHLLLGRGELFVAFLHKARSALLAPVTKTSGRDLSNQLYAAARTVHHNSDAIVDKFVFTVPPKDHVSPKCDVWSVMRLDYRPPWPLHLLLSPAVVTSYNTVFNFLLQVKIAELNLHRVWIDNVKDKTARCGAVWRVRNLLTFVVHNLQCWLQMDVIGAEFDALLAALDTARDFEQVIHRHSLFLANVSSQAFLLSKQVQNPGQPAIIKRHPVNTCLVGILKQCDRFCQLVGGAGGGAGGVGEVEGEVERHLAVLLDLMGLLGERGGAAGLRTLLMRIDFNFHCSRHIANADHTALQ